MTCEMSTTTMADWVIKESMEEIDATEERIKHVLAPESPALIDGKLMTFGEVRHEKNSDPIPATEQARIVLGSVDTIRLHKQDTGGLIWVVDDFIIKALYRAGGVMIELKDGYYWSAELP